MSNVGPCVTTDEVHAAFANYNLVSVRISKFNDTGVCICLNRGLFILQCFVRCTLLWSAGLCANLM